MMRLRRYRLFLLVAAVAIVSVYQLTRVKHWEHPALEALVGLKNDHGTKKVAAGTDSSEEPPVPAPAPEVPAEPRVQSAHPALPPIEFPENVPVPPPQEGIASSTSSSSSDTRPAGPQEELLAQHPNFDGDDGKEVDGHGESRPGLKTQPVEPGRAYWSQQEEHFPIPSESLILLPAGESKALPRVQHNFGREKPSIKTDRLRKQTMIREAFKHAWFGYKNYSLPHDELKPISKDVGDPFNGWGATLVDSLDTLWIMGLRDEFHDAVTEVGRIDFKTSARKDIPLFETTIRYLGGLIAAYDLSSGNYPVLLDKAVELADILMGAFDTPNRMPAVFYNWAPSSASRPHRASEHTVLAEIGSLAVEFTRLAQITREHRYYDAIARVTNALEEWQMKTTFPGLWPLKLDASGCKKPKVVPRSAADGHDGGSEAVTSVKSRDGREELFAMEGAGTDNWRKPDENPSKVLTKRQQLSSPPQNEEPTEKGIRPNAAEQMPKPLSDTELGEEDVDDSRCEPQGLSTEPDSTTHTYGIGSMADSTYEYFPKEYALLGGLNQQYKNLYLDAMEIVREELLFRPMTKENHDILFLAKQNISPKAKDPAKRKVTIYEGTHLGCFAGGMFALGSKLFNIPSDMVIAEKLTDACVWAYASTPVGVMAEEFELVPCDSRASCKWNETKWFEALDPKLEERMRAVEIYNVNQQRLYDQLLAGADAVQDNGDDSVISRMGADPSLKKRDTPMEFGEQERPETIFSDDAATQTEGQRRMSFTPRVALPHQKYVAAKIQEERLPPGYTRIKARDYRLRPEAIESVFIMYRLTGDEAWRDKGWAMFDAVDKATRTEVANAGIRDVTSQLMEQQDSMESFWLAETLKYYYLLFSEPDLISLDDYVLNTEAHPFKRPK